MLFKTNCKELARTWLPEQRTSCVDTETSKAMPLEYKASLAAMETEGLVFPDCKEWHNHRIFRCTRSGRKT
eukprot:scaffold18890_cov13-Tisochrysis_lutea.AAC.1